MGLRSLTGKPTFYPKLAELTSGEVIFEKGKLVKSEPGIKYPASTNWIFEVNEPIVTEKGEFTRVGISAGQVTKALENEEMGGDYRIVYLGSRVMEKGSYAGQKAHSFDVQKYETETVVVTPTETVKVNPVVAAAKVVEAKTATTTDSLDDMMN